MKKRKNRGMALASTLIMMTIVLMMCTLMVTVTLYGAQVTGLQTQNVEDRVVLDDIGNRFLKDRDNPDNTLIYIVNHNEGMKYVDATGDEVDELTLSNGKKVISGEMKGIKISITLEEKNSSCTLTVTGARRLNQLMKITCTKTTDIRTGAVTTTLKNWQYGD